MIDEEHLMSIGPVHFGPPLLQFEISFCYSARESEVRRVEGLGSGGKKNTRWLANSILKVMNTATKGETR